MSSMRPRVGEFFAGIGLAKLGVEEGGMDVVWSNDISAKKARMFSQHFYEGNHPDSYEVGDIGDFESRRIPRDLDVAWASFPCTDLSLAGGRAGLHAGAASSTFWHFVKSLSRLGDDRPRVIALENVTGFATSRAGKDIAGAIRALNGLGYSMDVLALDAARFVPQSRPRIFLVGIMDAEIVQPRSSSAINGELRPDWSQPIYQNPSLRTHVFDLPSLPPMRTDGFTAIADSLPAHAPEWWHGDRSAGFFASLSDLQRARLDLIKAAPVIARRTAYRRMRAGVPRWEIRRDDIAGCLRTASGGSSRQAVVEAGFGEARVRWMSPREYAKLMGAASYDFDGLRPNEAYSGFGDGVCVPVVKWLTENYLVPVLRESTRTTKK